jgi:hypothetical protein
VDLSDVVGEVVAAGDPRHPPTDMIAAAEGGERHNGFWISGGLFPQVSVLSAKGGWRSEGDQRDVSPRLVVVWWLACL